MEFISNKKGDTCTIGTLKLISRMSDLYMVQFKHELISNQLKKLTHFARARHIIIADNSSVIRTKNQNNQAINKKLLLITEMTLFITIDIGIVITNLLFSN